MTPAPKPRSKGKNSNNNNSKKKKQQPRKLSVDELCQAAEHASNSGDLRHAIALFSVALQKCDQQAQINNAAVTVVDVYERRAQVHVSTQNHEAALHDYQAALQRVLASSTSTSTTAMTTAVAANGSINDENYKIMKQFAHAAALYMYIGQLSVATDALQAYTSGIDCWHKAIAAVSRCQQQQQHQQLMEYQEQLATASCTLAELYLTDLCFEENAESECERLLQQALSAAEAARDGTNSKHDTTTVNHDSKNNNQHQHSPCLDAWQTYASLRLSQNRPMEAIPYIQRVFDACQTGCQALASLVGLRAPKNDATAAGGADGAGATELLELQEVQDLPGFEFRCQTAKLLLECHQNAVSVLQEAAAENTSDTTTTTRTANSSNSLLAEHAIDVLGSLLAENDEVIEIWALAGDAFYAAAAAAASSRSSSSDKKEHDNNKDEHDSAEDQLALAVHYWERALDMLHVVQASMVSEQEEDISEQHEDELQQQLDEVVGQIQDLQSKVEESRSSTNNDAESGDDAMQE